MTNQISFFTAVDYSLYLGEKTTWKSLDHYVDDYFYLGGKKAYAIETESGDKRTAVFESNDTETFISTAFKVVSYVSIIIPLIMLGLKLVLRYQHSYAHLQNNMKLPLFDKFKKNACNRLDGCFYFLSHSIFMSNNARDISQSNCYNKLLELAHPYVRKDRDLVLAAVKTCGLELEFADESFKNDKEIVLAALKKSTKALQFADDSLKKDKDFILETLNISTDALQFADDSLKKDKTFVYDAFNSGLINLKHVHDDLKNDQDFILELLQQSHQSLDSINVCRHILYTMGILLKKNTDFMLEAIKVSEETIYYIDDSLRLNKQFIIKAAEINPLAFFLIDKSVINLQSLYEFQYDNHWGITYTIAGKYNDTSEKSITYDDAISVLDFFVNNPKFFSMNLYELEDKLESYNFPVLFFTRLENAKKSLLSPKLFLEGIKKKYDKETVSALLDVVKISSPIEYEAIVKEIDNDESEQRNALYKTYKTNNLNFRFK